MKSVLLVGIRHTHIWCTWKMALAFDLCGLLTIPFAICMHLCKMPWCYNTFHRNNNYWKNGVKLFNENKKGNKNWTLVNHWANGVAKYTIKGYAFPMKPRNRFLFMIFGKMKPTHRTRIDSNSHESSNCFNFFLTCKQDEDEIKYHAHSQQKCAK